MSVSASTDGELLRRAAAGDRAAFSESLELADDGLPGRVEVVEELGADAYAFCVAQLPTGEVRLVARADARHPPACGDRVALRPRLDEAHLFDSISGARLGE